MEDDGNSIRRVCEVTARLLKRNCKDEITTFKLHHKKGNEDPPIDIKEYEDEYQYVVSVPGSWWKTNVTVEAKNKNELTISQETKSIHRSEEKKVKYLSRERISRDFKTVVRIPSDADINAISVDRSWKHGQVTVAVKKVVPTSHETRKVPISVPLGPSLGATLIICMVLLLAH